MPRVTVTTQGRYAIVTSPGPSQIRDFDATLYMTTAMRKLAVNPSECTGYYTAYSSLFAIKYGSKRIKT